MEENIFVPLLILWMFVDEREIISQLLLDGLEEKNLSPFKFFLKVRSVIFISRESLSIVNFYLARYYYLDS